MVRGSPSCIGKVSECALADDNRADSVDKTGSATTALLGYGKELSVKIEALKIVPSSLIEEKSSFRFVPAISYISCREFEKVISLYGLKSKEAEIASKNSSRLTSLEGRIRTKQAGTSGFPEPSPGVHIVTKKPSTLHLGGVTRTALLGPPGGGGSLTHLFSRAITSMAAGSATAERHVMRTKSATDRPSAGAATTRGCDCGTGCSCAKAATETITAITKIIDLICTPPLDTRLSPLTDVVGLFEHLTGGGYYTLPDQPALAQSPGKTSQGLRRHSRGSSSEVPRFVFRYRLTEGNRQRLGRSLRVLLAENEDQRRCR
jgi:hypothetical protein